MTEHSKAGISEDQANSTELEGVKKIILIILESYLVEIVINMSIHLPESEILLKYLLKKNDTFGHKKTCRSIGIGSSH